MTVREIRKHYGPGPHPGTGTEQSVHSGGAPHMSDEEYAAATPAERLKYIQDWGRFRGHDPKIVTPPTAPNTVNYLSKFADIGQDTVEGVVLVHGKPYRPPASAKDNLARLAERGLEPGPLKACYANAGREVVLNSLMSNRNQDLVYVEGFAMTPMGIPVQHAWLADGEGNVYDVTWSGAEVEIDGHPGMGLSSSQPGTEYYGIPFDSKWLRARVVEQEFWGVFQGGSSQHELIAEDGLVDAIAKHYPGSHDQESHGNWARGISGQQQFDVGEAGERLSAIDYLRAEGAYIPSYLEDAEDYEIDEWVTGDWAYWKGCRDIRQAASELVADIEETGEVIDPARDAGAKVPNDMSADSPHVQAFILLDQLHESSPTFDPLYRAMADQEGRSDFWTQMKEGAEFDAPLLSFADEYKRGAQPFLGKMFGDGVLIVLEPGADGTKTATARSDFVPMYAQSDEDQFLDTIEEWFQSDAVDEDLDSETRFFAQSRLDMLDRYRQNPTIGVQDTINDWASDIDVIPKWAGTPIDVDEDPDTYYEVLDYGSENPQEVISGGRFRVTRIEDGDPDFGKVVYLDQIGVFDPFNHTLTMNKRKVPLFDFPDWNIPLAPKKKRDVRKHYGPGPHPSGSDQSAHAGGRSAASADVVPGSTLERLKFAPHNMDFEAVLDKIKGMEWAKDAHIEFDFYPGPWEEDADEFSITVVKEGLPRFYLNADKDMTSQVMNFGEEGPADVLLMQARAIEIMHDNPRGRALLEKLNDYQVKFTHNRLQGQTTRGLTLDAVGTHYGPTREIYMAWAYELEKGWDPMLRSSQQMAETMAHEFGHALDYKSGKGIERYWSRDHVPRGEDLLQVAEFPIQNPTMRLAHFVSNWASSSGEPLRGRRDGRDIAAPLSKRLSALWAYPARERDLTEFYAEAVELWVFKPRALSDTVKAYNRNLDLIDEFKEWGFFQGAFGTDPVRVYPEDRMPTNILRYKLEKDLGRISKRWFFVKAVSDEFTDEDAELFFLLQEWAQDELGVILPVEGMSTEEALEVLEDMWDKQEENIAKHAVHDQQDHGNWADGTSDPDTPAWQRRLDAISEAPRATPELRLSARLGNPEAKAALRAAGSWEAKQMIGNIQQTWTRNGEFAFIDEQPSRIFYLIDMKNDTEDDYLYWQKTDTDHLPNVERYLKMRGWSKL